MVLGLRKIHLGPWRLWECPLEQLGVPGYLPKSAGTENTMKSIRCRIPQKGTLLPESSEQVRWSSQPLILDKDQQWDSHPWSKIAPEEFWSLLKKFWQHSEEENLKIMAQKGTEGKLQFFFFCSPSGNSVCLFKGQILYRQTSYDPNRRLDKHSS